MFMTSNNEQTSSTSINMYSIVGHSFFVQHDRISYMTDDEMKATIGDIHSAQSSFLLSVLDHSSTSSGQTRPEKPFQDHPS